MVLALRPAGSRLERWMFLKFECGKQLNTPGRFACLCRENLYGQIEKSVVTMGADWFGIQFDWTPIKK